MKNNHGTAVAKKDFGELVKKGDKGIITAYLPKDEIFAVFFGNGKWITFKQSEQEFKENCKVKLNETE